MKEAPACYAVSFPLVISCLPDVSLQEVEAEAMERWLDDGGASDHEAVYDARGVSPLQFLKP